MSAMVLLVVNDKAKNEDLTSILKKDYSVVSVYSGRQAVIQAKQHRLDAVVVDATSQRLNYKTVCRKLRTTSTAPLVLISSPNAKPDSLFAPVSAIHPPVGAKRLLQRIRTAIDSTPPRVISVGSISLDLEKRRVSRGSRSYRLTPKQLCLLKLLMAQPGQIVTRKTLMEEIWNTDYLGDTRTLDVHIRWVREKVEDNPSRPKRLVTVKGQGYRFTQ